METTPNMEGFRSLEKDLDLFRVLVERSGELICLHDVDGKFLYINPSLKALTGFEPRELLGRNPYDFIHPEDREKNRIEFREPAKQGQFTVPMQYRFLKKDGTYIYFQTLTQPIENSDGRITYLHTSSRDITQQVEITENLQQEKKFSTLMSELAHVGAWESNLLTGKVYWSSEIYKILGRDESLGIDRETVYNKYGYPEDLEILRNCNVRAVEKGESYSVEHRMTTDSGKIIWVRTQGKPLYSRDAIIGVYGAMQDITFSKLVEEEIRLSEKKFSEAFHSSGNGILLVDKNSRFLEINQSFAKMLGYEPQELLYKSFQDVTHPDDYKIGNEAFQKIVTGEKNNAQFAKRYVHHKGHTVWVFITAVGVRKDSGELMFIVSQVQDISRKRILENILREKNARLKSVSSHLKERINQLEEFNQIVSHNMRSPIGNISTLVKFLEEAETEEEKQEYLDYLKRTSEQLLSTLNEIVEVIKIRQNPKVSSELISYETTFSKVKSMFFGQIVENGAEIISDFTLSPTVLYPSVYLESILLNLLSNSLKYRSEERSPVIQFKTYVNEGIHFLEVEDNGLGIDLNKHGNQIFKLHKRFHRDTEGRGLGLYMTKNQIESLGGEIHIESTPGIGTKFIIQLLKPNEFNI